MRPPLAALAIAALFLAAPAGGQTTSASGSACGCPQIKPVATNDKPDPRHIHNEMTLADLEGYFSNREALYDGDWEKAMLALAHDIDPSGQMKISTGAAPPPKRPLSIKEGGISYYLLHEAPPVPQRPGAVPRGQRSENDSGFVMGRIVATLARINKYGEPQFGLRRALMATARFMARDLTNVPLEQARAEPRGTAARALFIGRTAYGLIGTRLAMAANFAYGEYVDSFAKQAEVANKAGELPPPDPFDLANAALDIVLSLDDKGHRDGLAYRDPITPPLVASAVAAASLRSVFGAASASGLQAAPVFQRLKANFGGKDSPAEAVGCKAFSILAMLAATDAKDGVKYRKALLSAMGRDWSKDRYFHRDPMQPGDTGYPFKYARSRFVAARSLLIVAGMTAEDDARNLAKSLFSGADHDWHLGPAPQFRIAMEDGFTTMRDFEGHLKGPGRADFAKGMQEYLAQLRHELDPNSGPYYRGDEGQRFLAAWEASKPDWNPVIAEPLCKPPAVPPKPILLVKGVFDDFQVDKFYVGVPMKVGLLFDEPYDADSYPVTVEAGGASRQLTAHPVNKARTRYETESFVP